MATPDVALTLLSGSVGQPVVIVGPSLGTRVERLWSRPARLLSGYRVIGWDLPGHGRSAPVTQSFSTKELANAVLRAVDTLVDADAPLRYAGDSFGGCVGLQIVLDHPDRVEAAAILCSAAKIATAEVWRERVYRVRREGLLSEQRACPKRWFGDRVKARPTSESRAVVDELADVDAASYCAACEALGEFDVRDRLSGIQVPLLAVAGSDDLVTTPEQNRELAGQTPRASFAVLPGVGHLAPLEDPAATVALLEQHFGKESSG